MSDTIDQILESGNKERNPSGASKNSGWFGMFIVGCFILLAVLVAGTIFVAVVTTTAKTYVSKPAWLRKSHIVIPQRKEVTYDYTPELAISGRTNDGNSYVYDIVLVFGFPAKQKQVDAEFARRGLELQDLLRGFFSLQTARDLAPANEEKLKAQLLERINKFLKTGKIEEILFLRLDVN